jgi:hypothetical protein
MANNTSTPNEIYVDSTESTPEGLLNVKRREPALGGASEPLSNIAGETGGTLAPDYIGSTDPDAEVPYVEVYPDVDYQEPGIVPGSGPLSPPSSFNIISQELKMGASGGAVVDVVFETDDIIGATNYEIRITKIE